MIYELEADYGDAGTFTHRDPYSFVPTLGELDLYLIGEGRHEHLYELLGAHIREHEGVTGTAFAVWAPAARAVNLVGDFNFWNGIAHPMRSLGSTGIWELFVPDVQAGVRYKFEVVTQVGEIRDQGRPVRPAGRAAAGDRLDRRPFRSRLEPGGGEVDRAAALRASS